MSKHHRMRRLQAVLFNAILITLCISAAALAQSDTGTIGGYIRDASGAFVPGAKIVLLNEATGATYPSTTDSQGHYTITNLRAGD